MSLLAKRHRNRDTNIWPGFVDALATLLMVIIFVLMIFIVAQFYLTQALTGRDEALSRLQQQVSELVDLLAMERDSNAELRASKAQLTLDLQASLIARDRAEARIKSIAAQQETLESRLAEALSERAALQKRIVELQSGDGAVKDQLLAVIKERDALVGKLRAVEEELEIVTQKRDEFAAELTDATQIIAADREKIELQLAELERLRRDIAALETVRVDLEKQVAGLVAARDTLSADKQTLEGEKQSLEETAAAVQEALGQARLRGSKLLTRLRDQQDKTLLAQEQLAAREISLAELTSQYDLSVETLTETQGQLTAAQKASEEALAQVTLLNLQIVELRKQFASIQAALQASESENEAQKVKIVDLGQRLNAALATEVQKLARFRSEFFGRLREVLADRRDIRIVGDRFVFQSEVLFASGSADIGEKGKERLSQFADTLRDLIPKIPADINWVLQVDGHTDSVPIFNERFRDNWDLSAARAISVVQYLITQGVPAKHLAATGYGQFQPIDPRPDEFGLRRNRRIEMKLTQR
ncbi:MAG: chemotaxis protein [Nisaea sp.]|nr:chemotaxis protein [Nisaea sp.]